MGDIHDQFLRRKREIARLACPQCPAKFPGDKALKDHSFKEHTNLDISLSCNKPLHDSVPIAPASKTSPVGSSATQHRHSNTCFSTTRPNAPLLPTQAVCRSQTPQLPDTDSAPMQISRLSLEEQHHGNLIARINRLDTSSPSKKRPASSEAYGPLPASVCTAKKKAVRHKPNDLPGISPPVPTSDFQRPPAHGTLFVPGAEPVKKHAQRRVPRLKPTCRRHNEHQMALTINSAQLNEADLLSSKKTPVLESHTLLRDVSAISITADQLSLELKELYRSLEIVEKRCISITQLYISGKAKPAIPTSEHWRVLTSLHRRLLYEHHDFLLASQHPKAPAELRALPAERQIPFRMWKHAIHAYLELLRQHLPESLEYMESFIYLAYQMMALLFETVRLFEDVWTECLGDLARYRMAIESQKVSVREVWGDVAGYWYTKASDRQPLVGRLLHHLGLLAKPDLPKQLFYYSKALCCVQPFPNAKYSIEALFEATDSPHSSKPPGPLHASDDHFIRLHKHMYESKSMREVLVALNEYLPMFADAFPSSDKGLKEYGMYLAISNIAACFQYGDQNSPLRAAIEHRHSTQTTRKPVSEVDTYTCIAMNTLTSTLRIVLLQPENKSVLTHVHVVLAFVQELLPCVDTCTEAYMLLQVVPWFELAQFLNACSSDKKSLPDRVRFASSKEAFMMHDTGDARPLAEDFAMRGLLWCQKYFPDSWFDGYTNVELPHHESTSVEVMRAQRVLWLGIRIAQTSTFLEFDPSTAIFAGE